MQERKKNKLKDYSSMAGPLGVSHLCVFSRSDAGNTHLKLALHPRGPTLTFRVDNYVLCKDIVKSQKHPISGGNEYLIPPLLVMNNIASPADANIEPIQKQLESLTTTVFQNMFPPINPQTTPPSTIKRVLLLNREKTEEGTFVLSLRHYVIRLKRPGVSRKVRKLEATEKHKNVGLPNLGRLEDAGDYLLGADGFTSASETELDTDAEVEVKETTARRVLTKTEREAIRSGEKKGSRIGGETSINKMAVKLIEIGPRMKLRLIKLEEGVCDGKVMWNEFVTKTKAEEKELDSKWEKKNKEKEQRKKIQRENVERKKQLKKNTKANAGDDAGNDDEEEYDSDMLDAMDEDGEEDVDNEAENE